MVTTRDAVGLGVGLGVGVGVGDSVGVIGAAVDRVGRVGVGDDSLVGATSLHPTSPATTATRPIASLTL